MVRNLMHINVWCSFLYLKHKKFFEVFKMLDEMRTISFDRKYEAIKTILYFQIYIISDKNT